MRRTSLRRGAALLALDEPGGYVGQGKSQSQLAAGSSQLRYSSYCKKEPAPK